MSLFIRCFIVVCLLVGTDALRAQDSTLLNRADSTVRDTVQQMVAGDTTILKDSVLAPPVVPPKPSELLDYRKAYWKTVQANELIGNNKGNVLRLPMEHRVAPDKDQFFYLVCGLLFLLGILRIAFGKYFQDLFRLVFRNTSFRQKQLREQMQQTPLASLLMNFFFVLTGGVYVSLLLHHYERVPRNSFWTLTGLCVAALAMLYLLKFLVLKLAGWIFAVQEGMETYSFIVFTVNKILGLALLPAVVLIAFTAQPVLDFAITISWILIAGLFIFRYFLAWTAVAREVKVSRFHFFLYLCAFEIAPLLIIYKALSGYM